MKKSILQYAIQGKLVEQRAEEGTAEELYQQIQEEKQKLIAEKKIKKDTKRKLPLRGGSTNFLICSKFRTLQSVSEPGTETDHRP